MEVKLSEEEREEVHEGLMLRVEQTKKAKKTNEEAGLRLGAREAEQRLRLLRGQDGEPGLLSKFVDQTELHMPAGNGEGGEGGGGDDGDLFDGADRSTKGKGPKPRKSRSKATAAVETVNEADRTAPSTTEPEYEIVEENPPPPKADQVTSLVPS